MATREFRFCERKRKKITVFNPFELIRTLWYRRNLSINNFFNVLTVARECLQSGSDSWLIKADFKEKPIAETIPLIKKQPSNEIIELMIEGYQKSADEDVVIAKEFEGIETTIDDDCYP